MTGQYHAGPVQAYRLAGVAHARREARVGTNYFLRRCREEAVTAAIIPASYEREAMDRAENDDAGREIAKDLERQHPRWIVIFGTREFICIPRFAVSPALVGVIMASVPRPCLAAHPAWIPCCRRGGRLPPPRTAASTGRRPAAHAHGRLYCRLAGTRSDRGSFGWRGPAGGSSRSCAEDGAAVQRPGRSVQMEQQRKDGRGLITLNKVLLSGSPADVQRKVEELACDLGSDAYIAGTRLRELAVALALHADFDVSAVAYEDGSQELEVILAGHPRGDVMVIGQLGEGFQLEWQRWIPIEDQPGIETIVHLTRAVLNAASRPARARNADVRSET
jgi:hypothetical protein